MARETVVKLVDDLDGSEATGTVRFGLDTFSYEIDLNGKHESDLRRTLGTYIAVARRVRPDAIRGRGPARQTGDRERNAAIREWAANEGVQLPSRGRIANVVQQAYDDHDGDALRDALGLELVEEKPRRGRKSIVAEFSAA